MNKTLEELAEEDPMVEPKDGGARVKPLLGETWRPRWNREGDKQGNTTGLEVLGGAVGVWD